MILRYTTFIHTKFLGTMSTTLFRKYETFWPFLQNALFVKMTHRKKERERNLGSSSKKRDFCQKVRPTQVFLVLQQQPHPRDRWLRTWLGVLILANLMIIICEASHSRRVVLFLTVFPTQNCTEIGRSWRNCSQMNLQYYLTRITGTDYPIG